MTASLLGGLVDNPFDSALFVPTVIRVGCLLLGASMIVVALERGSVRRIRSSSLGAKIGSWWVMAPLYLAAVFVGGPVALLIIGFMVVQGLGEYSRLVGLSRRFAWVLLVAGLATFVLTGALARWFLFAPLVFFVVVTAVPIVSGEVEGAHRHVTSALFGYVYIPFMLSYLAYIKVVNPTGVTILVITGLAIALSDISAFTLGSLLGKRKLAPRISPHKTWAGVAGNVLGAFAGWMLMWFAVPEEWTAVTRIVVPTITALAALYGDLVQSFVKRDFGVKDAGDLLPGFGGLLDRIDSLLVGLPISYYAIVVSQHYTA